MTVFGYGMSNEERKRLIRAAIQEDPYNVDPWLQDVYTEEFGSYFDPDEDEDEEEEEEW